MRRALDTFIAEVCLLRERCGVRFMYVFGAVPANDAGELAIKTVWHAPSERRTDEHPAFTERG